MTLFNENSSMKSILSSFLVTCRFIFYKWWARATSTVFLWSETFCFRLSTFYWICFSLLKKIVLMFWISSSSLPYILSFSLPFSCMQMAVNFIVKSSSWLLCLYCFELFICLVYTKLTPTESKFLVISRWLKYDEDSYF